MNQTRRKFVLTSASVPAALLLQACGGGEGAPGLADAGVSPHASALAATKPTSGGYILVNPLDKGSIFGEKVLDYFVPVSRTVRTQAVLHTLRNTAFVSLQEEVVDPKTGVTHHVCLSLELTGFPAEGKTEQYDSSKPYKGILVVNTTKDGVVGAENCVYDLKAGHVKVTHKESGVLELDFVKIPIYSWWGGVIGYDDVEGSKASDLPPSTWPPTTSGSMFGSNLAKGSFGLRSPDKNKVTVAYMKEQGGWI